MWCHGLREYVKYPLTRDPRTVQWWSEQSDDAQAAFTDPVDLREALDRFTAWLYDVTRVNREETGNSNACIWSHGASFDPPILAAAYEAVGLPVPWHYRAPRDTRTLFDVAGITDHTEWLKQHPGPLGLAHHALDDSICQARAVCAAYERIAGWQRDAGRYAWLRDDNAYTPEEQHVRGGYDLDLLCDEGEYRA